MVAYAFVWGFCEKGSVEQPSPLELKQRTKENIKFLAYKQYERVVRKERECDSFHNLSIHTVHAIGKRIQSLYAVISPR